MGVTMKIQQTVDLTAPLRMQEAKNLIVTGDNNANTIILDVVEDGKPADLSGCSATAYMIRADGQKPFVKGTISDNRVTVCLGESFYAVPGRYDLFLRLTHTDGTKCTPLWLTGYAKNEGSGDLIDTENVVPDLEDLLAEIEAMETATANANAATQAANTAAAYATTTADEAAAKAVEIATAKGEEALQNVETAVEAQNATLAQMAADILTKAPAIECEASGSLVTVTDAAAQPVVQLITHIEPVQEGEGDPSPDNVRPISGWDSVTAQRTGKNLLNIELGKSQTTNDCTVSIDGDGVITINGTATANFSVYLGVYAYGGECILTKNDVSGSSGSAYITTYNANGDSVGTNFATDAKNVLFVGAPQNTRVTLVVMAGTYSSVRVQVIIRPTSIDDGTYEPYQGKTLTAALPKTVYGGTVDWETGEMLVDRAIYAITGDENWAISGIDTGDTSGSTRYECNVNSIPYAVKYEVVCDTYPFNGTNVAGCWTNNAFPVFQLRIMWQYDTTEELKAYLKERYDVGNPVTVAYYITPYTLQLTPQQLDLLKGTNNIWSSTGDTDLVYVADTKMYIDNQIAAIAAAALNA